MNSPLHNCRMCRFWRPVIDPTVTVPEEHGLRYGECRFNAPAARSSVGDMPSGRNFPLTAPSDWCAHFALAHDMQAKFRGMTG